MAFDRLRRRLAPLALAALLALSPAAAAQEQPAGEGAQALAQYRDALALGTVNNNLGRYREAESAFRRAWEACQALHGADAPACGDALIRVAMEVSNQRRFDEAALLFAMAEPLARAAASPLHHPRFLTYRAMDFANRGDYAGAHALVVEANAARRALLRDGGGDAEALLADLTHGLFVQASLSLQLDRVEEATVLAHLTRRLIRRSPLLPDWWVANVDELLARIDYRNGDVREAERRMQMALETRRFALGEARPVALAHLSLGALYAGDERDTDALDAARPGIAILGEELADGPGVEPDQVLPFLLAGEAERRDAPAEAAALYDEMFAAGQLVRGSLTAQTIARTAARLAADDPETAALIDRAQAAADRRDQLRLELGRLAVALEDEAGRDALVRVRGEYAAAARRAEALEAELREALPEYRRLLAAGPADPARIQALLQPGEALAYFLVGAREGFVFLLQPDRVAAARVPLGAGELAETVARLRSPFERAGSQVRPFDMAEAHRLHAALFGGVAGELAAVEHLVVVPSGPLLSLPFALLIDEPPAGLGPTAYGRASWLVGRMAVTTVPSVAAFADLRGVPPSSAPRPIVGFGNPVFAGDGDGLAALARHCRADASVPPELLRALSPLPGTETELQRAAAALGAGAGDLHLGAGASEPALRSLPLDQYRVVYFATHGLLPGELRCQAEPGLALTPPAEPAGDRAADGLLEASEIAMLRLDADLVVLSACNTAGGDGGFGGEALSGLARAFFQAGARSLLVSHWQVDSVATTRLMTALFGGLPAGGGGTAEALRRAQTAMIAAPDTAHPYFWAAFTLVGAGT